MAIEAMSLKDVSSVLRLRAQLKISSVFAPFNYPKFAAIERADM
jgi:hypothetical protein